MKIIISIAAIFVFISVLSYDAYAIPAFARQYKLSCQTCHAPVPKLKAFGDEFAGNGFVLEDKENSRYFVETGDQELSLIRDFPVAVRFDLVGSYNTANKKKGDFGTPYNLKFLSGGSLAKDISYYFYFFFSERGEVAGVEDAYIMFNNIFGVDLDLYIGQFQTSDPLFKREIRLTFEDYDIYKAKIGLNHANLTYDRGLMLTLGLETGTDIILEAVNGSGIGAADELKLFDDDDNKNFMARISQSFGDFLRVGAFGYLGQQYMTNDVTKVNSDFLMAGPDATISFGDFAELNLQYVIRNDDEALLSQSDNAMNEIKTQGGFAELIITPKGDQSKQYGVLLFNYVDSDFTKLNKKSATVHLGHVFRRNIRFFTEYTYTEDEELGKYGKFNVGIVSAF